MLTRTFNRYAGLFRLNEVLVIFGYMVLGVIVPGCAQLAVNLSPPSLESKSLPTDLFGLKDEEYYSEPDKTEEAVIAKLRDKGFTGVVVGAPQVVDITEKQELPALVCERRSFKDTGTLLFDEFAVLIAVDLDSGLANASLAEEIPFEREEIPPPPGDIGGDIPEGTSSQLHILDVRERTDISWTESNLLLLVAIGSTVSDGAYTTLVSKNAPNSAAVSAYRLERAQHGAPRTVTYPVGNPVPTYSESDQSPSAPGEPGILLEGSKQFSPTAREAIVIEGSFVTPVNEYDHVTNDPSTIEQYPNGIVPIAVLITGSKQGLVDFYNMHVPVDEIVTAAGHHIAKGRFSIDLRARLGQPPKGERYFIHALSRDIFSNVHTIEISE